MSPWPSAAALLLALAVTPAAAAPTLRYLALGDSYTIGESVAAESRWPVLLADGLRARGVAIAPPTVIARTGWTTDELDAAIDRAELAPPYDLVSLLIGVNNQYRGRDAAEYCAQFAALLERAIGFAGGAPDRVVVVSIPDWGVTPFAVRSGRDPAAIAAELDAFNAIAAAEAARRGVAYVDITPLSRDPGRTPAMLADDGLHPSAAQYALWAERIVPVAAALLEADTPR